MKLAVAGCARMMSRTSCPPSGPGVSEHGFLAVVVLRFVDMEGKIVVAPSGEGARGFAQVLLGVIADAHGEQFHELAAEILVRAPFQVLPGVEIDEHCRDRARRRKAASRNFPRRAPGTA